MKCLVISIVSIGFAACLLSSHLSAASATFYLPISPTGLSNDEETSPNPSPGNEETTWELSSGTIPDASVAQPFTFDMSQFVTPTGLFGFSWSTADLPDWAAVDSSTGLLTGTPKENDVGATTFTVNALRSGLSDHNIYSVNVSIADLLADTVSTGTSHTCALTTDRKVKCWGELSGFSNGQGKSASPIEVNGWTDVKAVDAGFYSTCAILSNGQIDCVGDNPPPFHGSAPLNGKQISIGDRFGCIVTTNHEAYCFGNGASGATTSPTRIDGVFKINLPNVSSITTNDRTACAISEGNVYCWGSAGRIIGSPGSMSVTPVLVNGTSGATSVKVGREHACAIIGGGVKCWGSNSSYQLGDGTRNHSLLPVDVISQSTGIVEISVGLQFSCSLSDSNVVYCWGSNQSKALGADQTGANTNTINRFNGTPVKLSNSSGSSHTCILNSDAKVECWGSNMYFESGADQEMALATPALVDGT